MAFVHQPRTRSTDLVLSVSTYWFVRKLPSCHLCDAIMTCYSWCCRVHLLWAAIVGQPCNSIIICRVQLGQATSQLWQRTGIDDVRHRFWLSTVQRHIGQSRLVTISSGRHHNDPAQCASNSGETIVIEGDQYLVVGLRGQPLSGSWPLTCDFCWIRVLPRLIPGWQLLWWWYSDMIWWWYFVSYN